jgi:hypothetical protein
MPLELAFIEQRSPLTGKGSFDLPALVDSVDVDQRRATRTAVVDARERSAQESRFPSAHPRKPDRQ